MRVITKMRPCREGGGQAGRAGRSRCLAAGAEAGSQSRLPRRRQCKLLRRRQCSSVGKPLSLTAATPKGLPATTSSHPLAFMAGALADSSNKVSYTPTKTTSASFPTNAQRAAPPTAPSWTGRWQSPRCCAPTSPPRGCPPPPAATRAAASGGQQLRRLKAAVPQGRPTAQAGGWMA